MDDTKPRVLDRHIIPSQLMAWPLSVVIGFVGGLGLLFVLLAVLPDRWGLWSFAPFGLFILLLAIPGVVSIYPDHVQIWWLWSRRLDAADIVGMERYAFVWKRARYAGGTFHLRSGRRVRVVLGRGE